MDETYKNLEKFIYSRSFKVKEKHQASIVITNHLMNTSV